MESHMLQTTPDAGETSPFTLTCCILTILLAQQRLGWGEFLFCFVLLI